MNYTGKAKINIKEAIAGRDTHFKVTYYVGSMGIDEGGEVLICRRDISDLEIPQFDDSALPGFVKVSQKTSAKLKISYIPHRYIRP